MRVVWATDSIIVLAAAELRKFQLVSQYIGYGLHSADARCGPVAVRVAVKNFERIEKAQKFYDIKEKSHFSTKEKCEILAETERFELSRRFPDLLP